MKKLCMLLMLVFLGTAWGNYWDALNSSLTKSILNRVCVDEYHDIMFQEETAKMELQGLRGLADSYDANSASKILNDAEIEYKTSMLKYANAVKRACADYRKKSGAW